MNCQKQLNHIILLPYIDPIIGIIPLYLKQRYTEVYTARQVDTMFIGPKNAVQPSPPPCPLFLLLLHAWNSTFME